MCWARLRQPTRGMSPSLPVVKFISENWTACIVWAVRNKWLGDWVLAGCPRKLNPQILRQTLRGSNIRGPRAQESRTRKKSGVPGYKADCSDSQEDAGLSQAGGRGCSVREERPSWDINPSALPACVQLYWDSAWPWGSESATAVAMGAENLSTGDIAAQRELGADDSRGLSCSWTGCWDSEGCWATSCRLLEVTEKEQGERGCLNLQYPPGPEGRIWEDPSPTIFAQPLLGSSPKERSLKHRQSRLVLCWILLLLAQ